MPKLTADISGFTGSYLNRNGSFTWQVSRLRLIHATLTVGLPHFGLVFDSSSAVHFSLGKAFLVCAACDWTQTDLKPPKFFARLDASEKGNISYWLGMSMAKVAAHRIVQVGWPVHAAPLKKAGILTLGAAAGNRLTDLVGLDQQGRWHVFEAKGRGAKPTAAELVKWKAQARTVTHVNGLAIQTSNRCVTIRGRKYRFDNEDPPMKDKPHRAYEIDVDKMAALKNDLLDDFLSQGDPEMVGDARVNQVGIDPVTGAKVFVGLGDETASGSVFETGDTLTLVGPEGIAISLRGGKLDALIQETVVDQVETTNSLSEGKTISKSRKIHEQS